MVLCINSSVSMHFKFLKSKISFKVCIVQDSCKLSIACMYMQSCQPIGWFCVPQQTAMNICMFEFPSKAAAPRDIHTLHQEIFTASIFHKLSSYF